MNLFDGVLLPQRVFVLLLFNLCGKDGAKIQRRLWEKCP